MTSRWFAVLASLALLPLFAVPALTAEIPRAVECGLSPTDWCPSPPGDSCGAHQDADACRDDTKCFGMPYRGESVIACIFDERGFSSNCPTVGCTSEPPKKPGTAPR
jgi:hypothetical protein